MTIINDGAIGVTGKCNVCHSPVHNFHSPSVGSNAFIAKCRNPNCEHHNGEGYSTELPNWVIKLITLDDIEVCLNMQTMLDGTDESYEMLNEAFMLALPINITVEMVESLDAYRIAFVNKVRALAKKHKCESPIMGTVIDLGGSTCAELAADGENLITTYPPEGHGDYGWPTY